MTKQEHDNMIKAKIEELAKLELEAANSRHPLFASNHEAYAVILEEVEEIDLEIKYLKHYLDILWELTKGDRGNKGSDCKLKEHALRLAQEAIQVAAMCDKALMSEKVRG